MMEEKKIDSVQDFIEKAESRKTECFTRLGRSFFRNHRDSADDAELELIREIDSLNQDVRDAICSMSSTETAQPDQRKCQNCGAPLEDDQLFCIECGARAVKPEEMRLSQPQVITCRICGAAIKEGHLFCTQCGTKVETEKNVLLRCPDCGKVVGASQLFCTECGRRMK